MKIKVIETDEFKIKELKYASAFTCKVMNLDEENLSEIAKVFLSKGLVKEDAEKKGFT